MSHHCRGCGSSTAAVSLSYCTRTSTKQQAPTQHTGTSTHTQHTPQDVGLVNDLERILAAAGAVPGEHHVRVAAVADTPQQIKVGQGQLQPACRGRGQEQQRGGSPATRRSTGRWGGGSRDVWGRCPSLVEIAWATRGATFAARPGASGEVHEKHKTRQARTEVHYWVAHRFHSF